jgi:tetratricopeptide (TPR) repeat protein
MKANRSLAMLCLTLWAGTLGCAAIHVGQQVQAGRNALRTGRPNDAVIYFIQAAQSDPDYHTPYRIQQSVLTYLGRAYYETGRYSDAKDVLEKTLMKNRSDPLANLYLGLVRLREGEPAGLVEVESGLRDLHATLEYLAADNVNGLFWDPARKIRTDIERALTIDRDVPLLIALAEEIGRDFDAEIDKARRDEGRTRNGRGGGGGD